MRKVSEKNDKSWEMEKNGILIHNAYTNILKGMTKYMTARIYKNSEVPIQRELLLPKQILKCQSKGIYNSQISRTCSCLPEHNLLQN